MRILATLPTYNEAGNITALLAELLALHAAIEALVVDDNSPDGTWKLVQEAQAAHAGNPRIHLIHRRGERGRGSAGLAAFVWARDQGFDAVVEMDADFSHHPRFIPALLEPVRAGKADVVVGSRLISGGGESGRHPGRRLITLAANAYIRLMLRLPVKDCTSGFRVFSRRALETLPWEKMSATGPEIVQEILLEARRANLMMTEVPIQFEERRAGESTFNARIMLRSFGYVLLRRIRG